MHSYCTPVVRCRDAHAAIMCGFLGDLQLASQLLPPLRISVNACRQSGLRTTIMHMTADTRFVFDIVRACVYKQTGFMLLWAFQSHSRTSSTTEISCIPRHRGGIAA